MSTIILILAKMSTDIFVYSDMNNVEIIPISDINEN